MNSNNGDPWQKPPPPHRQRVSGSGPEGALRELSESQLVVVGRTTDGSKNAAQDQVGWKQLQPISENG